MDEIVFDTAHLHVRFTLQSWMLHVPVLLGAIRQGLQGSTDVRNSPPPCHPASPKNHPPRMPPSIPGMISTRTPYPPLFITFPASQPAIKPTKMNSIKPMYRYLRAFSDTLKMQPHKAELMLLRRAQTPVKAVWHLKLFRLLCLLCPNLRPTCPRRPGYLRSNSSRHNSLTATTIVAAAVTRRNCGLGTPIQSSDSTLNCRQLSL